MKAKEFFDLTAKMRQEQIAYYATKGKYPIEAQKHLIEAKRLERLLDAAIKQGLDEPTAEPARQGDLFEGDVKPNWNWQEIMDKAQSEKNDPA